MNLNELTAISPVDGRYRKSLIGLAEFFSEYGLIKYRLQVEIEYFTALCKLPLPQLAGFDNSKLQTLKFILTNFGERDALAIKEFERNTNHDVKAVEYFLKRKFEEMGMDEYKEFIHFGLTSQDINNTAIPMLLKEALDHQFYPQLRKIISVLKSLSKEWHGIPMLARTHGQPASPTTLGKEIKVFVARIENQIELLKTVPFSAKFGGATGNFNAHYAAFPDIDWISFANRFLEVSLELKRSHPTTQIEHYDNLAALFDNIKRINTILVDFCRDFWHYISIGYFKQKIQQNEVGSSAMPHKVNPIDFENAEGNLGVANALFEHLSAKLPVSRLQRDLTDSTVLRNIGVPIAHSLLALKSLEKGLGKLELNEEVLEQDLKENWAVVAEGIQTILRREGYPNPYESLKALTRKNSKITQEIIEEFVDKLDVKDEVKAELKAITPYNYIGSKD
ncbi:MAG: adenylosuccinate lyase [Bacteroidetes bacterium]|nr:adenylosuccinate lyase [Bacteroidota bacterium]MDA1121034.1 adenylosuccinate lyase [Bacteroidota bacterium]